MPAVCSVYSGTGRHATVFIRRLTRCATIESTSWHFWSSSHCTIAISPHLLGTHFKRVSFALVDSHSDRYCRSAKQGTLRHGSESVEQTTMPRSYRWAHGCLSRKRARTNDMIVGHWHAGTREACPKRFWRQQHAAGMLHAQNERCHSC